MSKYEASFFVSLFFSENGKINRLVIIHELMRVLSIMTNTIMFDSFLKKGMRAMLIGVAVLAVFGSAALALRADAATPNLVVSATLPPNPLGGGASFVSTFTVTNSGDATSTQSTVVITYPRAIDSTSGITRAFSILSGITCSAYTPRSGDIKQTCAVPALAPGASMAVATYRATGPMTIPYYGLSTYAKGTGPTNAVNVVWQWSGTGPADLQPSLTTTPNPVIVGRRATTSVTIMNNGYTSTGGFTLHGSVPGTIVSVAPSNILTTACTFVGGEADCTTSISNGGYLGLTIVYDVPMVPGTYPVTVSVDTGNVVPETSETNNVATGSLSVTDQVVRLHSSSVNPLTAVVPNTVFTRTLIVTNDGTIPAVNVSLLDDQPQTTFVSATGPAGTSCSAWYVTLRFNNKQYRGTSCNLGTIPAGGSVAVNVTLAVPSTLLPRTYSDTLTPSTYSFQDPLNVSTSVGSVTVAPVSGPVAPTNIGAVTISGNAVLDSTLISTSGTWIGTAPVVYTYQWQQCDATGSTCTNILGATSATYVARSADVGMTLRSNVTATNAAGSVSASSAVSAAVIGSVAPVNTVAPALIPGLEKQPGFVWGVTTGTWTSTPAPTYTYQWERCDLSGTVCEDIVGETSSSYVLQDADVFSQVRAQVTAINSAGSATAPSNFTGEVDPLG